MTEEQLRINRMIFDQGLYTMIEALKILRMNTSLTHDEKLTAIMQVEKMLPQFRRALIFLKNVKVDGEVPSDANRHD